MPTNRAKRRLMRLVLFAIAGWALLALGRGSHRRTEHVPDVPVNEIESVADRVSSPAPVHPYRTRATFRRRRLAASVTFATLFFTGASFSAVAGDGVVRFLDANRDECANVHEVASAETEAEADVVCENAEAEEVAAEAAAPADEPAATEAAPAADEPAESASPSETAPAPTAGGGPSETEAINAEAAAADATASEAPAAPAAHEDEQETATSAPRAGRGRRPFNLQPRPVDIAHAPHAQLDPEVDPDGANATVWLHRALPDPTPASLRLAPWFARKLAKTARTERVAWPLLLGVLRADGVRASSLPGRAATMDDVARSLAAAKAHEDAWTAALAVTGRTVQADRAVALSHYYRAVGLRSLVRGLRAERKAIAKRLLEDERALIYDAGRADIAADRVDVRIVALIAYLAEAHEQVTVSSLVAGHRLYARPGVISAHVYGHAVDISSLGGVSITGNQDPGGITEKAVRNILLLPAEMLPRQVISLLGLGGPSFPLADHWNHIHVGY